MITLKLFSYTNRYYTNNYYFYYDENNKKAIKYTTYLNITHNYHNKKYFL